MTKYLTLFITIIGLNICKAQEVVATQQLTDFLTPDGNYIIETTIHKSPSVNSIKFAQTLPSGFSASRFNSFQGDFCFQDNIVIIEWKKTPRSSLFTFSYALNIPKDMIGNITMNGNVFYDLDTNNQKFDINYKIIKVENVIATHRDTLKTMPIDTATLEASLSTKFYKIQFGVFRLKKDNFGDIPGITSMPYENGMVKFYTGKYNTLEEAYKDLPNIVAKGYKDAFVVEFEDGKVTKQLILQN
jgi:hypothetical protein